MYIEKILYNKIHIKNLMVLHHFIGLLYLALVSILHLFQSPNNITFTVFVICGSCLRKACWLLINMHHFIARLYLALVSILYLFQSPNNITFTVFVICGSCLRKACWLLINMYVPEIEVVSREDWVSPWSLLGFCLYGFIWFYVEIIVQEN